VNPGPVENWPLDFWWHFICQKEPMDLSGFPVENGTWKYKSKTDLPGTLLMNNVSGAGLPLDCLEPHEAKHSLGIHLAPDGNHAAKLQFCKEQTLFWAAQLTHSKAP